MSSFNRNECLPVGVLLPTLNSMPLLEMHLDELKSLLYRVEQVVVVDSFSTDGTVDYLVENLSHPSLKILQHPPGLYESWNYGIQHIDAEWLYIATVGDRISEDGIDKLYRSCRMHRLDVAISAPVFLMPSGEEVDKTWPIHQYIKCAGKPLGSHEMSSEEVFLWNTLYIPGSLMGSSASNLYRTDFMKCHPFRTDLGHAGDIAWGIENAFSARWGAVSDCDSVFLLHQQASRWTKSARLKFKEELFALSRRVFQLEKGEGASKLAQYSDQLSCYWAAASKHLQIKSEFVRSRGGEKARYFSLKLWRYRIQQSVYSRKKVSCRNKVIGKLYS